MGVGGRKRVEMDEIEWRWVEMDESVWSWLEVGTCDC